MGEAGQGSDSADASAEAEGMHVLELPIPLQHQVFAKLGPKDLCGVTATCTLWRDINRDESANRQWKAFFASRWRLPSMGALQPQQPGVPPSWQTLYGSKMYSLRAWGGKHSVDTLRGHKAGVKAVRLLPSHNLAATGSLDKTVKLWDLELGMPLATSRPLGGTVRAVALDAQLLAAGGTDGVLRTWDAVSGGGGAGGSDVDDLDPLDDGGLGLLAAGDDPPALGGRPGPALLFDLARRERPLRGHIGPISCLSLTDDCLISGSWDYSVRVWRRSDWSCASLHRYSDFVWSVVQRGGWLLVSAGAEVHVHDAASGKLVRKFENLHDGHVSSLEGTHSGRLLFTGAADGLVLAHDLRMRDPSVICWHHNAGVAGLAWEDPWLASCSADGSAQMMNTEAAQPTNLRSGKQTAASSKQPTASSGSGGVRRRTLNPGAGPAYCIDIADQWVAVGCDNEVVRTWDFTGALEAEERAAAARAARASRRARRRRTSNAQQQHASTDGAGSGAAQQQERQKLCSGAGSNAGRQQQHLQQASAPLQLQGRHWRGAAGSPGAASASPATPRGGFHSGGAGSPWQAPGGGSWQRGHQQQPGPWSAGTHAGAGGWQGSHHAGQAGMHHWSQPQPAHAPFSNSAGAGWARYGAAHGYGASPVSPPMRRSRLQPPPAAPPSVYMSAGQSPPDGAPGSRQRSWHLLRQPHQQQAQPPAGCGGAGHSGSTS